MGWLYWGAVVITVLVLIPLYLEHTSTKKGRK